MKKLLPWLIVLLILTVGFGTIYVAVQQAQRADANYPQIQMAEDVATELDNKTDPQVLMHDRVDIHKSLAPFTIVYDKKGKAVAGSGFIDGKLPKAPIGILQDSKDGVYNAVTWEPDKNTRVAAVTVEAKNFYVLSGRSLKEIEKNETNTLDVALLGWLISVLMLAVLFVVNVRSSEEY